MPAVSAPSASSSNGSVMTIAAPLSDPASKLIWVLQYNLGWTTHRVSMRLNIPLMVVEECSRTGKASEILRHQLRNWLREEKENGTLLADLPSKVVHAVLSNSATVLSEGINEPSSYPPADLTRQQVSTGEAQGNGHQVVAADDEDLDESFQSLDPLSRHHFEYLRKTVGCNFVSIITDPSDRRTAGTTTGTTAAWDWVENTVTTLLDDTPEALARRRLIKAESVQDLFNLHPVTRDTFRPYLTYITPSYKANWAEKQKHNEEPSSSISAGDTHCHENNNNNTSSTASAPSSASKRRRTQQYTAQVQNSQNARILPSHPTASENDLPWPDWVAEEFFEAEKFSISTNLLSKLATIHSATDEKETDSQSQGNWGSKQKNDDPSLISKKEWERVLSSTTPPPPPPAVITPQQLQEETADLVALIDTVDGNLADVNYCLLVHVLSHSEDFFRASQELEILSNNSSTTIFELRDTRTTVITSGESVVRRYMQTLQLHRQRMNLQSILSVLDLVTSFLVACRSISIDGGGIRLVVASLQEAMRMRFNDDRGDGDTTIPHGSLSDLRCLDSLTVDLLQMNQQLQETLTQNCCELLRPSRWSERPIDWSEAADYLAAAKECGVLRPVMTAFQQDVCDYCWCIVQEEIQRVTTTTSSPSSTPAAGTKEASQPYPTNDPRGKQTILRSAVQPLKPQRYIHFITDVMVRLGYFHSDVVTNCNNMTHYLSEFLSTEELAAAFDASGIRLGLVHSLQVVLIDLIECREAENASMIFFDMMQLIRQVFQFITGLEEPGGGDSGSSLVNGNLKKDDGIPVVKEGASSIVASTMGPLRAALASQARALFRKEHDRQQEKMLLVLGQEMWTPNEMVEQAYQRYCDLLCACSSEAVSDFRKLAVDSNVELTNRALQHAFGTGRVATEDSEHFERKVYLTDEGKSDEEIVEAGFMVTTSLLLLLHSLYDYDRYLAAFPFLAPDVTMKIHDALKLFDGQCAALVLGAGAVAQGTLESISVQNLAVASQCTGFLIELTARIKHRIAAVAGSPKLAPFLKHLDRVQKDLTEHRNEYMAKVAAMVREKIDGVPFEPGMWATEGSGWVMMLLKETARALKHIRAVVRPLDRKGFMVPIVGIVAQRVKSAIHAMPSDVLAGCRNQIKSDVALLEANSVKFGYNAVLCMETRDVSSALALADPNPPMASREFLKAFHPSLAD